MRRLARGLIAQEMQEKKSSETMAAAAFLVPEKLRQPLTVLMGIGGFRGLLSRALAVAIEEVRWLRAVHVTSDGTFEGVEPLLERIDPAEFSEGRIVLLAQLLGLLVAFIGPSLTARLVREIWPKIARNDLDLIGGKEK